VTLRSPIVAMLWELWRVTRTEAAWKLAFGVVVPLSALLVSAVFAASGNVERHKDVTDSMASIGRFLLYLPHLVGWVSVAALGGGRLGFPLYLHYSRPIRTTVMVGLPMAYLTFLTFAIYLLSAFVLRATAGYSHPLVLAAAWIAVFTVVLNTIAWSIRGLGVVMLGLLGALFAGGPFVGSRLDSFPTGAGYPLIDVALMALTGLVCFGVTVASVARQRRGGAQAAIPRIPGSGLWERLIDLFRLPCPSSSATRAQVWLALKSNGLPVLTIGVACAILILLVSAVSAPIDAALNADPAVPCKIKECFYVRAWPPLFIVPFSMFTVFFLGRKVFGICRTQGRTYVSAFDATQAYGSAQLAVLRLLVNSACVLAALIAIAVSSWISMPLLGDAVFIQIWGVPLSSRRFVIADTFAAMTGLEQLALAIVAAVGVVVGVAAFAVFGALRARYSRRASIASFLLLVYGLAFVWLAVGGRMDPETASQLHLDVVYRVMRWIATAAMLVTTVYVFWSGFAERVLTIRYASGAVAISVAFAASWLTVLPVAGVQLAGMSAMNAVSVVSPALLPLMASVLAPWSYSRIRHT
jgi:hypothetical protein